MTVPYNQHALIAQLIIFIEGVHFQHKQTAFQRIRRKILRDQLRRLHRNKYQSIKITPDNQLSTNVQSGYVSVNDFRPIDQNYSSVRIMDFQTHGISKDIRAYVADKIANAESQIVCEDDQLQKWMLRGKCRELYPQNYPFSDLASKNIMSYHEEALQAVRKFTFSQFCRNYLKKQLGLLNLRELQPLKYQTQSLSTSLTKLPKDMVETAVELFDCLLRAGGYTDSQGHYLLQINKIIQVMSSSSDNLKEEMFIQLVKQISSQKLIYLKILCCVCYFVKPSTKIYIPLLNFLYEQSCIFERKQKQYLNFCFFHIINNFDKDRKYTPSLYQLFCAFNAAKIPILIRFPKQKVFFIQSFTTVQDFMSQLVGYYNLDKQICYLLQVNGFLMEKGYILQQYNSCSFKQSEQDYKWNDYQQFKGYNAIIVLKNMYHASYSQKTKNIMFNYSTQQYLRGMYGVSNVNMIKIAALKMQSQIQNYQQYLFQFDNLVSIRKILRMVDPKYKQKFKKYILFQFFNNVDISRQQARRQILQILSSSRGYSTHFFIGSICIEDYDDLQVWVGVQKQKLIIVEPSSGRIMNNIYYNRIEKWGKSVSQLCLKIDQIGEFHIESRQIQLLCSVFQGYLDYHVKRITL